LHEDRISVEFNQHGSTTFSIGSREGPKDVTLDRSKLMKTNGVKEFDSFILMINVIFI
jgi:hypothetical protein